MIFDKQCIDKNAFHKNEREISIDKVDSKRIVLSKKDFYGKKGSLKYFVRYISESNKFLIPTYIKSPQVKGYIKYFKDNEYMNLLLHDT